MHASSTVELQEFVLDFKLCRFQYNLTQHQSKCYTSEDLVGANHIFEILQCYWWAYWLAKWSKLWASTKRKTIIEAEAISGGSFFSISKRRNLTLDRAYHWATSPANFSRRIIHGWLGSRKTKGHGYGFARHRPPPLLPSVGCMKNKKKSRAAPTASPLSSLDQG